MKEMVGGCCVCSDERGWPDNPLVYCDGNGCSVAVHQACYGIVTVPTGPWFCRKCESPDTKAKVRCELCPSKSGALKRTDTSGWAHVVCALYIPEVRFGNVTSMEPIVLRLIPQERYNKTCYICQDLGKVNRASAGACMQCNKSGCKQQFHVTCAQGLGLLCEEAGNYLDNVKYCGYCQHHYSKLKKGGNVKTIPPYKPVSHDSHSSDSSGEKEGDGSPRAAGSGTPTQAKSKGPGRKATHTVVSGKSTPSTAKTPSSTPQSMESNQDTTGPKLVPAVVYRSKRKSPDKSGKLHHSDKKKPSPPRRGSSAGDGGSGSKSDTPAPSPQHSSDTSTPTPKVSGSSTPASASKVVPPTSSPSKPAETVAVISSVASALSATMPAVTTQSATTPTSVSATTSVVKSPISKPAYQESVITNTEETKQTKKRKAVNAVNAANNMNAPVVFTATTPPAVVSDGPPPLHIWENPHANSEGRESIERLIKKAKVDGPDAITVPTGHFSSVSSAPPPPPPPPAPARSPASYQSHPSPRGTITASPYSSGTRHFKKLAEYRHRRTSTSPRLPSPMPGPSGFNPMSNIRSPSHPPQARGEREGATSLLVSVPLPSTSHGLNLSTHSQMQMSSDMPGPSGSSSHIFHQQQKQNYAAMDTGLTGHSSHSSHPSHSMQNRTWGGLNVTYEMQQDQNKPGVSGMGKDMTAAAMSANQPATIRNKKRAAMAASMANPPSAIQTVTTQSLASMRRQPLPTPPPLYQELLKDSPPSSPSSDRSLKHKMETGRMGPSCTAPHMLGNILNPESGAAACLQEQLSAELAAHAAGTTSGDCMIPPPLINRAAPGLGYSGRSSSGAQTLDQLLERHWEQGSQFLMEQAQHFDIASLLSCLHQLRTENVRLEDHVSSLLQRRDHLLAVNARLAIPLASVPTGPPEPSRCPRDNGGIVRPPLPPSRNETITSERHQYVGQVRPPMPALPTETITSDRSHQYYFANARPPMYSLPTETITSERSRQLMMREMQQKPS